MGRINGYKITHSLSFRRVAHYSPSVLSSFHPCLFFSSSFHPSASSLLCILYQSCSSHFICIISLPFSPWFYFSSPHIIFTSSLLIYFTVSEYLSPNFHFLHLNPVTIICPQSWSASVPVYLNSVSLFLVSSHF